MWPWQRRIGREATAVRWDFGEVRDGAGEKAVGGKKCFGAELESGICNVHSGK